MSDDAQRRIQAIGQQLKSASGLPPVTKVAAGSSAPRLQGKVAIVTGKTLLDERLA
jgi:hypothetical protein